MSLTFIAFFLLFLLTANASSSSSSDDDDDDDDDSSHSASQPTSDAPWLEPDCAAYGPKQAYVFSASGAFPPFDAFDENGVFAGFSHDVLRETCAAAGKACTTQLMEDDQVIKTGSDFEQYCGPALQGAEVDGALGWYVTTRRSQFAIFSDAVTQGGQVVGGLVFKEAEQKKKKRIVIDEYYEKMGFIKGWITSPSQLALFELPKITFGEAVWFDTPNEQFQAIRNGELVTGFILESVVNEVDDMVMGLSQALDVGGLSAAMFNKRSACSVDWFNEALASVKASGKLAELCDKYEFTDCV